MSAMEKNNCIFLCRDGGTQFRLQQEEEERGVERWGEGRVFPKTSTEDSGECWEGCSQPALKRDDIISCARGRLILCVSLGPD